LTPPLFLIFVSSLRSLSSLLCVRIDIQGDSFGLLSSNG
jgi:hypothetical protein